MRILLVEDDAMIGAAVQAGLKRDGLAVDWVRDGESADAALRTVEFDAAVLDLGLPRRDGLQVLRELRARRKITPVLILTARDAVSDKVQGLDAGADDYMVKPFDLAELSARLRALARRKAGRAEPRIEHGALVLDTATKQATLAGRDVPLSGREYALLHALLQHPGAILSRAQLEERLYGWGDSVESNAVEVHIHALRRKLGAEFIRNVRGVGYRVAPAP
jgi:two-component system, OmpR family, response regulator QseB